MTHSEIKALIQKLIASAQIQPAIAVMRAYLLKAADGEDLFNALLLVESRFSQNEQRYTIQRSIALDDYQIESNSITAALIALSDDFPASSAATPAEMEQLLLANNLTKKQVGKILYSIPGAMQVSVPVICTIRIAPEEVYEAVLREGIDETNATHVERLQRISEVMKVELREVGTGSFEIIPLTSELEQIIYPNEYTEWLYQVTPLQTGVRTLTLEVSVVEILKEFGERRKSVKTLVRKIEVITTEVIQEQAFIEEKEPVAVTVAEQPRSVPAAPAAEDGFSAGMPPMMIPSAEASPPPSFKPIVTGASDNIPVSQAETTASSGDYSYYQAARDHAPAIVQPLGDEKQGTSAGSRGISSKITMGVTAVAVLIVGGWFFFRTPGINPGGTSDPMAAVGRPGQLDTLEFNTTTPAGDPVNNPVARPAKDDPFANPIAQGNPKQEDNISIDQSNHTADTRNGGNPAGQGQTLATAAQPLNLRQVFTAIQQMAFSSPALAQSFRETPDKTFTVTYTLSVSAAGAITRHTLQPGESAELEKACDRLVTQLKYTPGTAQGKATATRTKLVLNFRLSAPTTFTFLSGQ